MIVGQLSITQVRSVIGAKPDQRRTIRSLGLRRIRHTVIHPDRPEIRGMIVKVSHLVEVREVSTDREAADAPDAPRVKQRSGDTTGNSSIDG